MRIWFADLLLHAGWALFGQPCSCGSNPFNWIAKRIDPNAGWDEAGDRPVGIWGHFSWHVGYALVRAAGRLHQRS